MKTRTTNRIHDSERPHLVQVRQPTVRLRGRVAVSVASIAPPSRASDAASYNGAQSNSVDRLRLAEGAVLRAITPSSTPEVTTDAPSLPTGETAATLERTASSGQATTSGPSVASPRQGVQRRRGFTEAAAGGRGGGGRAAAPARTFNPYREFQPREFTSQVSSASSVSELQQLLEYGSKHDINSIHIATLWTRLAKLAYPPPASAGGGRIDTRTSRVGKRRGGTAPLVPARLVPEPAAVMAFVDELEAATTAEQLAAMAPRGLANLVWAAAKLKPEVAAGSSSPTTTGQAAAGTAPVETAASAGGASSSSSSTPVEESGEGEVTQATADSTNSSDSSRLLRARRVRGGRAAAQAAEATAADAEAAAVRRLSSTVVSEALLDAWAAAAARRLADFNMQDISNVVWALGRLGYAPRGMFMTQLCIALLKELPRADRPQQVSNVLLGLALLRYSPPVKDFWPPVWQAVQRLVLAEQQDPDVQGVTNTLWALGQLTAECPSSMPAVPAPLVSKAVFRAVQYGERISASQCQDVFTSLPRLGFEPSEYQASKLLALALRALPSADAQAVSNILVSLVHLRVQPWPAWKNEARRSFRPQVASASPEALARFLFAWAHLRATPPLWLRKVWERLQGQVNSLTAADVAFIILGANQMFPRLARRTRDPRQGPQEAAAAAAAAASDSAAAAAEDAALEEDEEEEDERLGADEGEAEEAVAPARNRIYPLDGGAKNRLPPRELLLALRDRWEVLGPEAHLSVQYKKRTIVQDVFDELAA